jgi:hypothetical protein
MFKGEPAPTPLGGSRIPSRAATTTAVAEGVRTRPRATWRLRSEPGLTVQMRGCPVRGLTTSTFRAKLESLGHWTVP